MEKDGKEGKDGKPEVQRIHIVSSGGEVNIRRGNGTEYRPITSVVPGSSPFLSAEYNEITVWVCRLDCYKAFFDADKLECTGTKC